MANQKTPHTLSGLQLCRSTSTVDIKKCIICQAGKRNTAATSKEHGRKRLTEAAAIRDDDVTKRLKTLDDSAEFSYHNDYQCYKKYTNATTLQQIVNERKEQSSCNIDDPQLEIKPVPIHLRSSTVPRSSPSTEIESDKLLCTICGRDRMQTHGDPNLSYFETFGGVVKKVLSAGLAVSPCESIHLICDSYVEESIKEGERIRRAGNVGAVEVSVLNESTPIPQQMEKFWVSSENKRKLLQLVRTVVAARTLPVPAILSGMVVNQEQVPALLYDTDTSDAVVIQELAGWLEEADDRIVPHAIWAVQRGSERIVVVSNDTDTVTRILYHIHLLMRNGLKELWIEFGTGEKRRLLPLHRMAERMGEPLCRVVVKAHVLTGDDVTSKIGTKLAAMQCDPTYYLTEFAETTDIREHTIDQVEEYLVRVWAGARSKPSAKTFDRMRLDVHINASSATAMSNMPPTSSAIRGHIKRAFFVLRGVVATEGSGLDCCQCGWESICGTLKPSKCMKPLSTNILSVCKCNGMCDTMRCCCRKAGVVCVIYCHKSHEGNCQNRD